MRFSLARYPGPVYPRVCGGTSERMYQMRLGSRSIPACAGEPSTDPPYNLNKDGLSPRVRGNRVPLARARLRSGSIPACAGEPPPTYSRS